MWRLRQRAWTLTERKTADAQHTEANRPLAAWTVGASNCFPSYDSLLVKNEGQRSSSDFDSGGKIFFLRRWKDMASSKSSTTTSTSSSTTSSISSSSSSSSSISSSSSSSSLSSQFDISTFPTEKCKYVVRRVKMLLSCLPVCTTYEGTTYRPTFGSFVSLCEPASCMSLSSPKLGSKDSSHRGEGGGYTATAARSKLKSRMTRTRDTQEDRSNDTERSVLKLNGPHSASQSADGTNRSLSYRLAHTFTALLDILTPHTTPTCDAPPHLHPLQSESSADRSTRTAPLLQRVTNEATSLKTPKLNSRAISTTVADVKRATRSIDEATRSTDDVTRSTIDKRVSGIDTDTTIGTSSSPTPLTFENLNKEYVACTTQGNFDGFRLEMQKPIPLTMANGQTNYNLLTLSNSVCLGTTARPCGYLYQFGPNFSSEDQSLNALMRIDTEGAVTARVTKTFSEGVEGKCQLATSLQRETDDSKMRMSTQQSSPTPTALELAVDKTGKDWTSTLKYLWQGASILSGSFTQISHPKFQLGAELLWITSMQTSIATVAARYAANSKNIVTGSITRQPDFSNLRDINCNTHSLKMQHTHKVSNRLTLASEVELSLPDKESTLRTGYEYTFRQARVTGSIDTAGKVSAFVQDSSGFGVSGSIDHQKGDYNFGFLMHIVPQQLSGVGQSSSESIEPQDAKHVL